MEYFDGSGTSRETATGQTVERACAARTETIYLGDRLRMFDGFQTPWKFHQILLQKGAWKRALGV